MDKFDLVVIGAGPGGYVAAIRASQLGLKVACVEKRGTLGGTCLNVGCIPSKALLNSSEKYEEAQHEFANHGVEFKGLGFNLDKMMKHKEEVVSGLTQGIEFLFKKNKVTWLKGEASFKSATELEIKNGKKKETVTAGKFLIATGSEIMSIPGVEIDEKQIVSSTGALSLPSVPKHLVVIGGGYIGLELGSVWARLGSKVTVVEFLDRITPTMDTEVAKQLKKNLEKLGMEFKLSTKVTSAKKDKKQVKLTLEPAQGGDSEDMKADFVLVSVGRRPFTDKLGLENAGVKTDERGFIPVNSLYQTEAPNIFAIGDVIGGAMLAHKAEDEAVVCVEMMTGQAGHIDYNCIPAVIYTWPECASVGFTEDQLKEAGVGYKAGKFPFMANSRARSNGGMVDGFVKILSEKETDRVLGCHIIGPDAGTMIAELALAMEFGASAEDIARTCHAHPTLNESVKEAALAVDGMALHI